MQDTYQQGKDKAESLYHCAKDSVSELYQEGKKKAGNVQASFQDGTNELVNAVKKKPLFSLFLAGAIGFIFSSLRK